MQKYELNYSGAPSSGKHNEQSATPEIPKA